MHPGRPTIKQIMKLYDDGRPTLKQVVAEMNRMELEIAEIKSSPHVFASDGVLGTPLCLVCGGEHEDDNHEQHQLRVV